MINKILLFAAVVLLFTSCRYEEGPGISFRSPETRIVSVWNLQNVELNGMPIDSTDHYGNQPGNSYTIYYNGKLIVNALINGELRSSDYGDWAFTQGQRDVEMYYVLKNRKYEYLADIKKLTYGQLLYEYTDENGDHWRLTFYSRSR